MKKCLEEYSKVGWPYRRCYLLKGIQTDSRLWICIYIWYIYIYIYIGIYIYIIDTKKWMYVCMVNIVNLKLTSNRSPKMSL